MAAYVNFLSTSDLAYIIAHCGFFMFNVLNVSYLLLFEWFAYRRFMKNFLSKMSIFACFIQAVSCISSIHRYNIHDPYGWYAQFGSATGLLATIPMNICFWYLCFDWNYRQYIKFGYVAFTILPIIFFFLGLKYWEDVPYFLFFRAYSGAIYVYQIIVVIRAYCAHKARKINIDESVMSRDTMNNVLAVNVLLHITGFALMNTGIPVFIYPGTGLIFSNFMILMVFAGQMDFMTQYSPVPAMVV